MSRGLAAAALMVSTWGGGAPELAASGPGYRSEDHTIAVVDGPGRDQEVDLDATLYVPAGADGGRPAPAVVAAHSFGSDKGGLRGEAVSLARKGYVVLAYSARGFGRSGGAIGLNAPDYDVADVRQLLDWLGDRPEVLKDGPGDPRVGMFGASYGGGITLLAAAYDRRIDAIAPLVTWNSLAGAFLPNHLVGPGPDGKAPPPGVFKQQWASLFFGIVPGPPGEGTRGLPPSPEPCLRFVERICEAYAETASDGQPSAATLALLGRSSPASVIDRVRVPTLLVQGQFDTLLELDEAVANADGIRANGAPVKMVWVAGGHSAPERLLGDEERTSALVSRWFQRWLRQDESVDTGPAFEWDGPGGRRASAPAYPLPDAQVLSLSADRRLVAEGEEVEPGEAVFLNPPGGQPAALSSILGLHGESGFGAQRPSELPAQHVAFESAPLSDDLDVVGVPRLSLRLASQTGQAVFFVKLYDVAPDGEAFLPHRAVAPVRVGGGLPGTVTVDLSGIVHRFRAGHRLRLVLAATDQAYTNLRTPERYTVRVVPGQRSQLTLPTAARVAFEPAPTAPGRAAPPPVRRRSGPPVVVPLVVAGLALVGGLGVRHARRRGRPVVLPTGTGERVRAGAAPLETVGLTKRFGEVLAVDGLDLRLGPGQVLGLLGPNGAGKTTALRMVLGLVHPTAGQACLFGQPVRPGLPELARVGALVEGPGFVPHLSGLDNLRLWWRAGGRPLEEADLAGALEVAGLGDAVHRRVRTYSHGMRQRLALAQALLGRPELLVLDEPTDGLDPAQMREVRHLVARLAGEGRTILLSSHLLAEVEQVCSHVAVMNRGRLVAVGPVAEVVGAGRTVYVEVDDPRAAVGILARLPGVEGVAPEHPGLAVTLDGLDRSRLVAELVRAGVGVRTVTTRRRLEEAFLGLLSEEDGDRP